MVTRERNMIVWIRTKGKERIRNCTSRVNEEDDNDDNVTATWREEVNKIQDKCN